MALQRQSDWSLWESLNESESHKYFDKLQLLLSRPRGFKVCYHSHRVSHRLFNTIFSFPIKKLFLLSNRTNLELHSEIWNEIYRVLFTVTVKRYRVL